jgi:aspartyl-tRNA(Asn)/glutamyl-tRNA(Gln) amidotransferase subunit A
LNTEELIKQSASEQRKALLNKDVTATELLDSLYKHIETEYDTIGDFNSLTKEQAYQTAKIVDEKIAKNEELPLLAGIPLSIKYNIN